MRRPRRGWMRCGRGLGFEMRHSGSGKRGRAVNSSSRLPRPESREGQTFAGASRLVRYANFVKLPHTLFALPFAMVGVTLASYVDEVTWHDVLWVTVAFTA